MEVQLSNLQEIHLEALPDGLQLPHIELRVGQVQQAPLGFESGLNDMQQSFFNQWRGSGIQTYTDPIEKQLLQLLQLRHSPKMLWPFYLEPLTNLESPQVSATQESVESVGSEIPDPPRSQHLLFWVFQGHPSPGAKNFHLAASHLLPHQLRVDGQAADSRQNWSRGQHLGTSTWEENAQVLIVCCMRFWNLGDIWTFRQIWPHDFAYPQQ